MALYTIAILDLKTMETSREVVGEYFSMNKMVDKYCANIFSTDMYVLYHIFGIIVV